MRLSFDATKPTMKPRCLGSFLFLAVSALLASWIFPTDTQSYFRRHLQPASSDHVATKENHRRQLTKIVLLGKKGTPPKSRIPLSECEGDCDPGKNVSVSIRTAKQPFS